MASGAGKAVQSPGLTPGQSSSVNGNAAEFQHVEQEQQHDFQMHSKMCKKIAQLTKVIYSLNMKNEEQEAALQALNHSHDQELHRILMDTCHQGEGSALRTRLLQLQESLDEQQRVGARVQADFECFRLHSEERERETEGELRRDFEKRLQAAEEELQQARSSISEAQQENQRLNRELKEARETIRELSDGCQRRDGGQVEQEEQEVECRMKALLEEVDTLKQERQRAQEENRRGAQEEKERWEQKLQEEKEEVRKKMEAERREEQRRWEEKEEEEKKGLHSALRERVKRAEAEAENHLEKMANNTRNTLKLQERIQNLEEELELDRKRVSEAEGVAKRAEEELAVAKERLLLQEDELQTRAEEVQSAGCQVCVCVDVDELKNQLSRLQSRNRELELQSSGRNNDHARQIRQHAEALSSQRSEMVRAQTEELRRIQKHADEERDKLQRELEQEREKLQKEREQEKSHLDKERNRLRREKEEEKEALRKGAEEVREHLRREKEEEAELLRKELEVERVRVRAQLDKRLEQVEVQLEEERRRLLEKAEEDRRRLKEQVRKAIEEVMRRHAAEINNTQEALSSEKKTNQEVCAHLEEERRRSGEIQERLDREREHFHTKIKDANNEIFRLKSALQQQQKEETSASEAAPHCGSHCARLQEQLSHVTAMQEEAEKQRERQQKDITSLRADKHRLEEKVLEHSRQTTERNLLEQSQRNTEDRIRAECEERLRAEFRIEMNAAVAESEQRWQNQEQDLHAQVARLQGQLDQMQAERQKTEEEERQKTEEDSHAILEMEEMKKEVQETREINKQLRERLQEPQSPSQAEERHSHTLQMLERRAKEDLLSERNRLHTMHHLELDKQRAELSQQHTEWSRQMTQRHMQQIEELQAQLQAHTHMMALQQDLKQQNQNQVFERQLDESRCAMLELQRENTTLKKQLQEKGMPIHPSPYRASHANHRAEEKEEKEDSPKSRDARLEEEARRLKEEVEKLRVEMEKLEESQKVWEERKEEDEKEEEKEEESAKEEAEERRRKDVEEMRKEHKKEIQNLQGEYSSAQMHLQARIVALENELREREDRCRRREPPSEDLQLGKLQERLAERDQLIKRLVEERHQLQLHPPVVGDNGSPRLRDNKPRPVSTTPTMRRKQTERGSSISCSGAYERLPPYSSASSTLPHQSSCHVSPRYSTSSLPHKHTSPSLPRSPRSRTSCVPPTPAPTAPLPVCPPPHTGIRYVSPSCQEPYLHPQAQTIRGPYVEQRGTAGLKQEWFTKYFSF
ncbi:protein FAM184B isoform X2 [Nerophis ophidion]|uniref:protein FAM184B isoform X2 n=1 Tax=Nerophis ophidion TaxID=159077 RepID=UPI002ADF3998|nr:protein FAM184B isoform X2 [Nerophis ophidion]